MDHQKAGCVIGRASDTSAPRGATGLLTECCGHPFLFEYFVIVRIPPDRKANVSKTARFLQKHLSV